MYSDPPLSPEPLVMGVILFAAVAIVVFGTVVFGIF